MPGTHLGVTYPDGQRFSHVKGIFVVNYELLRNEGILVIRPQESLEASDFQNIAQEIDPYIEANGKLHGVLIDAESFPGWKDLAALVAHLRFAREHHRKIERLAVVSDSNLLTMAPQIAGHFVQADVRHFGHSQKERALAWLREGDRNF
jgi:hypothetical protein